MENWTTEKLLETRERQEANLESLRAKVTRVMAAYDSAQAMQRKGDKMTEDQTAALEEGRRLLRLLQEFAVN